jgi:flavorubredoxin
MCDQAVPDPRLWCDVCCLQCVTRLSQTLARGVTKVGGVLTEMMDMLSADPQDLVALMGRSKGLVLMAPPNDSSEARASMATMLSAIQPGSKVRLIVVTQHCTCIRMW